MTHDQQFSSKKWGTCAQLLMYTKYAAQSVNSISVDYHDEFEELTLVDSGCWEGQT